jgi:hypothetical protein
MTSESNMSLDDLDDIYFSDKNLEWKDRLAAWLHSRASEAFPNANSSHITSSILTGDVSLRMVVNMPPATLINFLSEDDNGDYPKYKNTYELKAGAGQDKAVNPRRRRIDDALFGKDCGRNYYYGALAIGGSGIRYYGEYCLVMDLDLTRAKLFDRNSWDLEFEPLANKDKHAVIEHLSGEWKDAEYIAKLKVLPQLAEVVRLTTTATVSDAVLRDESFIEIHYPEKFDAKDIYEVRESPSLSAIEQHLESRLRHRHPINLEECLWLTRRGHVKTMLGRARVKSRVVETTGRSR